MRSPDEAAAAPDFAALELPYKTLVFRTIEDSVSCQPPRLEASFAPVVAAYCACQEVVEAARAGALAEQHLEKLARRIEAVGGIIAPDLRSHGEGSVAALRAASFEALRANFVPPVVEAALVALNARLRALQPEHLDQVFHALRLCLDPLLCPRPGAVGPMGFRGFTPERQLAVLRAYREASASQPPRPRASFDAIVAVHEAEQALLLAAAEGRFDTQLLHQLEARLQEAGGYLSPGLTTQGPQSVTAFRSGIWEALERRVQPKVAAALREALNARLAQESPGSTPELFAIVVRFLQPLLERGGNPATTRQFMRLDPERQIRVFRTLEVAMAERPGSDGQLFDLVVAALHTESELVHQAAAGQLSDAGLAELQCAIEAAGGTIVPGIRSSGEGSIGEFRSVTFQTLEEQFEPDVVLAVVATLNTRLKQQSPGSLGEVLQCTGSFLGPLLPAGTLSTPAPARPRAAAATPPVRHPATHPATPAARPPRQPGGRAEPQLTQTSGPSGSDSVLSPVQATAFAAEPDPSPPQERRAPVPAPAPAAASRPPVTALAPLPTPASPASGTGPETPMPGVPLAEPNAAPAPAVAPAAALPAPPVASVPPSAPAAPVLPAGTPVIAARPPENESLPVAPELSRFIEPLLIDMGIAVARMERQSLPDLLHQHGILRSVARDALLRRLCASVVFSPEQEGEIAAQLWEGLPGDPPAGAIDTWIGTLPSDEQSRIRGHWHQLKLRRWQEETYQDRLPLSFEARRADLERVVFARIQVRDSQLAQDLHRQLLQDPAGFAQLAGRFSEGEERYTQGLIGPRTLAEIDPAVRKVVAQLPVGGLHAPLRHGDVWLILRMEHRQPAVLEGELRQRLLEELFETDLQAVLEGQIAGIHASLLTARPLLRSDS